MIIGSFHSLKRANNTRSWTKTALNDYIEKVNGVMSQVLSLRDGLRTICSHCKYVLCFYAGTTRMPLRGFWAKNAILAAFKLIKLMKKSFDHFSSTESQKMLDISK